MKSAIVCGSNGFIGSKLVEELLNNEYLVYGIYNNNTDRLPKHTRFKPIKIDIKQINTYDLPECEYFYDCAWSGMTGPSRSDIELQLSNALNVKQLMLKANEIGCKRFINCGSIMEDEAYVSCTNQLTNSQPSYAYGMAKILSHYLCKSCDVPIEYVCAKITNVYGPGENSKRLINSLIKSHFQNKKFDLTPGNQYYDFIYISDAARAIRLIGENGISGKEYTVSYGKPDRLKNYLMILQKKLESEYFSFGSLPYHGPTLDPSYFDISELTYDTGFIPLIDFDTGTDILINEIKE